MDCPLCDLSKQEIVYEDEFCYSMVIIEPLKENHLMVLPKRHVTSLADLADKESLAITKILGRLGKIFVEDEGEDPIIFMNLGKHSTQPHIHFHILPSKGGLRHLFSEYEKIPVRVKATPKQLKSIGKSIRNKLEELND